MLGTMDAKLDAMQQQRLSETDLPGSSISPVTPADSVQGIGSLLLDRLRRGAHLQGQPVDISGWEKRLITAILQSTDDQSGTRVVNSELSHDRLNLVNQRFLQKLEYRQMKDRHAKIDEAYEDTFKWIWERTPNTDQQWSSFPSWLEWPTSLYWVAGKGGVPSSSCQAHPCALARWMSMAAAVECSAQFTLCSS